MVLFLLSMVPALAGVDGDGVADTEDNCPFVVNPDQEDLDGDGFGDACDACPDVPTETNNDSDDDGIGDDCDACPDDPDPSQEDRDGDGFGDVCDVCPDVVGENDGCPIPETGCAMIGTAGRATGMLVAVGLLGLGRRKGRTCPA